MSLDFLKCFSILIILFFFQISFTCFFQDQMSMRYQLSLILSVVKTIMQLLRGTFSTELFCMNKNSPTLQNMHVCLFFSVMTWDFFRVSECCGNERFIACCDVLLHWTPFKALGTDFHAAPLPEGSHGSFTWIWDSA